MYGEEHINTASCYQHLAGFYSRTQEFKKAFETQQKAHNILKKLLGEKSSIVLASKQQLDQYLQLSVATEKTKAMIGRPFGESKKVIKDPKLLQAFAAQEKAMRQKQTEESGDASKDASDQKVMKQEKAAIDKY